MGVEQSDFADFVRQHREARCWSRSELARRSGLTQAEISRLESAKRMPTLRHVRYLASVFSKTRQDGDPKSYANWLARMVDIGDDVRRKDRASRRTAAS